MKKGFKFNYVLKAYLPNDKSIKSISRNYMNKERAMQEYYYYKNCTDATVVILFNKNNKIEASFGI